LLNAYLATVSIVGNTDFIMVFKQVFIVLDLTYAWA
jgi:hypothetical protein